jgi:hypothetical protein
MEGGRGRRGGVFNLDERARSGGGLEGGWGGIGGGGFAGGHGGGGCVGSALSCP